MIRITELKLPIDHLPDAIRAAALDRLGLRNSELLSLRIFRRGVDARRRNGILLVYTLDLEVSDEAAVLRRCDGDARVGPTPDMHFAPLPRAPAGAARPLVIGAGPCGLFAALTLAEAGYRPIILERGKMVRQRTKDTWGLWRRSVLEPESNVQFGEGGAGTFSDGKLYSGIKDPERLGRRVLEVFVRCGAPSEILWVAKPHIGTFRLVTVVEAMRAEIEQLGGEYRFGARVERLLLAPGGRRVAGVRLAGGEEILSPHVVLAPGHSARDLFASLAAAGVYTEKKPFSIGVRIEHPQGMIDRARYGAAAGNPILGAADYKLVHHCANGRSVYSFCMCPGGTVVAAASEPGRVVTNGMSQYSRAERNANAGIVVGITPADYPGDVLAGVAFQREYESRAFDAGGGTYAAPAQLVGDFLAARPSTALGSIVPSYKPGVAPVDLAACLPDFAVAAIREALPVFGRRVAGFDTHDAVMTGVETRTSSPIRIARGADMQSLNTPGLFPAGEGAGYAGGILSAGVDGIRAAEAVAAAIAGGTVVRRRGTKVGWSGFILTGKSSASDGPLQPVVCRAFVSASNRRLMKADSSQAENALTTVAALRTARLILRQWQASDFAPFAALNDDPAVMEFMPKRLSHAESDMVAARLRDHIEAEGWGLWAVEVPGVAPFIGYTGLSAPGFKAHFTPCVEVGWRLARAYWGQGYATEAASAAIAHGFGALGLREIVSFTVPANVRSRAVMERLRMRHNPADDFDHPALPAGHKLRRHMLYRLPI